LLLGLLADLKFEQKVMTNSIQCNSYVFICQISQKNYCNSSLREINLMYDYEFKTENRLTYHLVN